MSRAAPGGWVALVASRWRQVLLGLVIGAVALVLALWGVDLREVGSAFARASLPWLVPVAVVFLAQQVVRAWRQAILVRAVVPSHTFRSSLSVLFVGTLVINALPARLGEVARPLLLLERDQVPLGSGFAVVVIERTMDLCAMFAMIGLVAWLVPVPSRELVVGSTAVDWVGLGRTAAAIGVPAILAILVAMLVGGQPVLALVGRIRRRLGPRLGRPLDLLLGVGGGFVRGMEGLRSPGRLVSVGLLTVLNWLLTGWTFPLLARAFGIRDLVGVGEGFGVLSVTMLGMLIPSAPGFAGTYEAFSRAGLALFGVAGETVTGLSLDAIAVAYTLTMHWWIFAVEAAVAVVFLVVDRIDLRRLGVLLAREAGRAP